MKLRSEKVHSEQMHLGNARRRREAGLPDAAVSHGAGWCQKSHAVYMFPRVAQRLQVRASALTILAFRVLAACPRVASSQPPDMLIVPIS